MQEKKISNNLEEEEEEDEYSSNEISIDLIQFIFNDTSKMKHHVMGKCPFPTGRIITADPLCYLQSHKNILFKSKKIKPGNYIIDISIVISKDYGLRISGARLKITSKVATKYEPAFCERKGKETDINGFGVEAGMGCFCDESAAKSYWKFLDGWYKEHKNGNIYDDYFAELFKKSYEENPDLQREGGDFLMWTNPNDGSMIPMFASGFGDGFYEDFWGIDEEGELCELVTIFLDPRSV